MTDHTREPQYQRCLDLQASRGLTALGLMSNQTWQDDPKRLLFVMARYKFVAKMLDGKQHALEVGCADAFGTRIVQQHVGRVTAVDFDPLFVEHARSRVDPDWPMEVFQHDLLSGPVSGNFDAAYCLDVIEHIDKADEDTFIGNLAGSVGPHGTAIVGSPSLESQTYASPPSKAGHVNCKSQPALGELMRRHFRHVFLFSMNDEVVHTGFGPMAHYLLALGCEPL